MLEAGQMLQNRYRIISLLGEGGMGAVYKAWDKRLKVPVALKEMTPQPGLDEHTLTQLRQQFEQEATVLARLSHPHLVRVGDYFEEQGNTYLVMDFVEGESLIQIIDREGALPEDRVLIWALQLLDALDYCHKRGVIHRDVKPQNVILTPEGQAMLVDFGLVKQWNPEQPETNTAMRGVGTPEYAPPEQYSAQAGHTDARSDLYSLAATMYHALAGEPPLCAVDCMADPDQFVPLRNVAPHVSEWTAMVVNKAMALARSQRWQSAEKMTAALLEGEIAPARPTVEPARSAEQVEAAYGTMHMASEPAAIAKTPPRSRKGWLWAAAALVVVPSLILGLWWVRSNQQAGPEPDRATQTPPAAQATTPSTGAPSPTTPSTSTPRPTRVSTAHPSTSDEALAFAKPILAAIADRAPDFEDGFDDPLSGWPRKKTTEVETGYLDGEFFAIAAPDYPSLSCECSRIPTFADFVLEVDGRFVSDGQGFWGVSWHWADGLVSGVLLPPAGEAPLVHCEGADCASLGEIRNPSLNPKGEGNHLHIIVQGTQIGVAINGEWQTLATDLYYATPGETRRARLDLINNGNTPLEVRWDNVRVWDISDLPEAP